MKRFVLIAWAVLAGLRLAAQSPYFIYLQSEPAASFSVTCKGRTVRSSQSGYLIIPNLTDSVLQLVVSFPGQTHPDHSFMVHTQYNDQGYLLKDYGEKGWGLLDWRKLVVTYTDRPTRSGPEPISPKGQDDFATLLAKAAGDSSLVTETKPVTESKPAPIPEAKPVPEPTPAPIPEVKPAPESKPASIPVPSYCTSILTEAEFKECIAKVEVAKSESSKVNVIRGFINGRCFTLEQVKSLSMLLATDEAKYDFLLEAWTQTVERARYPLLVSVFSSNSVADRFKEMFQ